MNLHDSLIMIVGASVFWVFMYIVFVTDDPETRGRVTKDQVMRVWSSIAMAILVSFGVWGVCKTEQRLDWLEDMAHSRPCDAKTIPSHSLAPPAEGVEWYVVPPPQPKSAITESILQFNDVPLNKIVDRLDCVIL